MALPSRIEAEMRYAKIRELTLQVAERSIQANANNQPSPAGNSSLELIISQAVRLGLDQ